MANSIPFKVEHIQLNRVIPNMNRIIVASVLMMGIIFRAAHTIHRYVVCVAVHVCCDEII